MRTWTGVLKQSPHVDGKPCCWRIQCIALDVLCIAIIRSSVYVCVCVCPVARALSSSVTFGGVGLAAVTV